MGVPFGALRSARDGAGRASGASGRWRRSARSSWAPSPRSSGRSARRARRRGRPAGLRARWPAASSQQRDPNLLTLAALLPLIVGDRDEALRLFDLAMVDAHRRGSLFAVTGMYLWRGFTLFWRGDLIDAEEELRASFDQAEAWGYGPDTLQWNAAHLSWCLTERGNLAERAHRR